MVHVLSSQERDAIALDLCQFFNKKSLFFLDHHVLHIFYTQPSEDRGMLSPVILTGRRLCKIRILPVFLVSSSYQKVNGTGTA